MTGGFLRPTVSNLPLPRLKPQPKCITMMIYNRRRSYERKGSLYADLTLHQEYLRLERNFEEGLLKKENREGRSTFEPVYDLEEWSK